MLSPRGFLFLRQQQQQQQHHDHHKKKQQQPRKQQQDRQRQADSLEYPTQDSSLPRQKDEDSRDHSDNTTSGSRSTTTPTTSAAAFRADAASDAASTKPPAATSSSDSMALKARSRTGAGAGTEASVISTPLPPPLTADPSSSPSKTIAIPVSIPASRHQREDKKRYIRHDHGPQNRHAPRREARNPDAIPPSVAALLAVTSIPRSRAQRSLGTDSGRQRAPRDERMTVDAIMQRAQRAEKEISLTLASDPMELLLDVSDKEADADCGPQSVLDFDDDASSIAGSMHSTGLSTATVSMDSFPSLDDSLTSRSSLLHLNSPHTPLTPVSPYMSPGRSGPGRRRSSRGPLRRRLEPVSSPPGSAVIDDHPLAAKRLVAPAPVEDLDFRVFGPPPAAPAEWRVLDMGLPLRPLKSAFKSNLTASLRALRNAARSISALGQASIPPEDFLTRSILTMDPRVPFTDERRPPRLDEEPSAALRRYLNPTTSARMESPPAPGARPARTAFTASIQMQTYKVRRSRTGASLGSPQVGIPNPSPQLGHAQAPGLDGPTAATSDSEPAPATDGPSSDLSNAGTSTPLAIPGRQREMRENSDFIRIAVMEMAMRKSGKLDDQRPGRARWALPPRRTSTTPYQIGPDGVPTRWVAIPAM